MSNDVTLFSNGIGHFRRVYTISGDKPEAISIPFKSDYIGDVAASLQVFGKVRLNTPPSYTPNDSMATSLSIEQNDAMKSMLRQLSGSSIDLKIRNEMEVRKCILLGLDCERTYQNNQATTETIFVTVMFNGAIQRHLLSDVVSVAFTDEGVQTEINKALKANFQQIKPDSTLVDLSLSSLDGKDVEAVVQYTIPVAAWKMRYSIRENNGKFSLECAAIIDNNTDEDWNDFKVSVVTGNPISFNTDIANVVVPQRKMVHLVDNFVAGNVEVGDAYGGGAMVMAACAGPTQNRALRSAQAMSKSSVSNYASFGLEAAPGGTSEAISYMAETPGVESKDVGDFCVFTSKEQITILARKSAVVPMFTKPLDSAGVVLLYKESNNNRRPYRSVKFKNETEYTLGRGKTVVYNEGVFSGECVLEMTKPGENRMLPHCLENGVRIIKEIKGDEVRQTALKISNGVAVSTEVQTSRTSYTVENKKDETFKVALEHTNRIANKTVATDFEGSDIKEREKLTDGTGARAYFELKPKEVKVINVTETCVGTMEMRLGNSFVWIRQHILDKDLFTSDKQIKACQTTQKEIDDVDEKLAENRGRVEDLQEQVERVRENVAAAKNATTGAVVDKWIQDLDASETEIRQINKTVIPDLNRQRQTLMNKLAEQIKKISASWADK